MLRFLHAADIHLDSPLHGLDEYEGAPVRAIRVAAREAFKKLVKLALAEHVDFVILAGDLYDGDWPDFNTGLFFVDAVRELEQARIPVVILKGNHDAASRITAQLTLPPNVHALPTDQAGTKVFDRLRVAVHGQGFAHQAETRNLAASYPPPLSGFFNIGVLHTALDGREGHDSYAPCTIEDLIGRGYDYWALGHVHQRESVNRERHPRIEFPGNLQGRHARETGAKGCLLVTVDPSGGANPEFRALDVFRWEAVAVDAREAEALADVLEAARAAVSEARDNADGRPLGVRVNLCCSESMCHRLGSDSERFRADLCGQVGGDIWIEKIRYRPIREPRTEEPTLSEDASSELRAVLDELRDRPDDRETIFTSGECGKLVSRLPPNLREAFKQSWNDVLDRASALLQNRTSEPAP